MRLERVRGLEIHPEARPPMGEISDDQGAAMARACVNLFGKWRLTDADACTLLGGISPATYSRWKKGAIAPPGVDLKMRLSILMGIHKALRHLFNEEGRLYAWVKKENAHFGGKSALSVMLGGQMTDLFKIRSYLDSVRG